MMNIDSIMTTDLITISPTENLDTARTLMHKNHIHHLPVIEGGLPNLVDLPTGCIFRARCEKSVARCETERPLLSGGQHRTACHLTDTAS